MSREKFIKLILLAMALSLSFILMDCVPPPADAGEEEVVQEEPKQDYDSSICDRYLSFAYSYYQNQNWKSCITNYKKMIDNGCGEDYANDIFAFYGRSYQQLAAQDPAYYDSALFVYQEGQNYLPRNEFLHKSVAYIYGVQGKIDFQIREYEKMAEETPENVEIYESLGKLYSKSERWNDFLWAANEILKIDPDNQQAVTDRLTAFEKLGKDPMEVIKNSWESDRTLKNGLDYVNELSNRNEFQTAIEVLKEITVTNLTDFDAWTKLAESYQNMGDIENKIKTNIHIYKTISPNSIPIVESIVSGYLDLQKYTEAYKWSKQAVASNQSSGLAYKLHGDVYNAVADNCVSGQPTFEDKLTYKLAYDNYRKAYQLGESAVKARLDYLKEYLIPSKEDWFMNKYNSNGDERKDFHPDKECYNWIEESAKKD